MKRYTIIFIALFCYTMSNGQTFRNYRLVIGAGAQVKPLYFLENKKYSNTLSESIKPTLTAEIPLVSRLSLAAQYSHHRYQYNISTKPEIQEFYGGISGENFNYTSKVNTVFSTWEFQARIYNSSLGFMAPWGNYIYYGVFNTSFKSKLENKNFEFPDKYGNLVLATLKNNKIKSEKYWGFSLGYGKKKYLNEMKNAFLDINLSYKILFNSMGDELLTYNQGITSQVSNKAMYKFQSGSIFNIQFTYGISI